PPFLDGRGRLHGRQRARELVRRNQHSHADILSYAESLTGPVVDSWIVGMKTILFAFRVSDLERSLAFYRAVGYTELSTVPFDDGSSLVWLKLPEEPAVSLELVHRP